MIHFLLLSTLLSTLLANANDCHVFSDASMSKVSHHSVTEYTTAFDICSDKMNVSMAAIRYLTFDNIQAALVVDPTTLKTQLIKTTCLSSCVHFNEKIYSESQYGQLLNQSMALPSTLQNDGITSGASTQKMVAVTIDMCPSKKGISQKVYDKLLSIAKSSGTTVPVGIAMTKKWMNKYPNHFEWIKKQHLEKKLDILWINHSANHFYDKNLPLEKNFLLSQNTQFDHEVLETEIALISAGVTPSIFFRFPGLVSSQKLIEQLVDWGLVTLGSNAWIALGNKPKSTNSIILIHGNQNEPKGETLFLNFVEQKSADIAWASVIDLLTLP